MKKRLIMLLAVICLTALLLPLTVSAETSDGWQKTSDELWVYYQNGEKVSDTVMKIGSAYYGFDWDGIMYDNTTFYYNEHEYRAKAGGALYVNEWVKDYGDWYYYGAEGKAPYDFLQISGKWYFFNYGGMMVTECLIYSDAYARYYVIDKAGTGSQALTTEGWHQAFGNWYYLYNDGDQLIPVYGELMEIKGKTYYFDWSGKMAANGFYEYWDAELDQSCRILVDQSGAIVQNGWALIDGDWYYVEEGQPYIEGIYEIGGKLYHFYYDGRMNDIPGEAYSEYGGIWVKDTSGALLRNEWQEITIGSPSDQGWAYYDENGFRVWEALLEINGSIYLFEHGLMQENYVLEHDDGVYVFDASGKGSLVDGWFQDPGTKDWMYAKDGMLYRDGIYTIGDADYAFNWNGSMITDQTCDDFLFGSNGKLVTTIGWHKVGGGWYYVTDTNGNLATGWQTINNKNYYFSPVMLANTVEYVGERATWCAFDNNGTPTALTGSGWKQVSYGRVYLEDGEPVRFTWKQIDGAWYYFGLDGGPYYDGIGWVDDEMYLFDTDGTWIENGWYQNCYYAKNGKLVTGLQTIDGKQYLFDETGCLVSQAFAEYDDKYYWLNGDGSVKAVLEAGWNAIGGKKYYFDEEDCSLLRNTLLWDENDVPTHGFGSDYAMCTNGVQYAWYDYYIFDASGNLLTGWQKIDGKWYYADPNSYDPYILNKGIYNIDGDEYYFKDGYMQTGTIMTESGIITTDSSGRITNEENLSDGWYYVDGSVIYYENGQYPTGWFGNYYVQDGRMMVNEVFTYAGKYYFAGKDGQYIRNGWHKVTSGDQSAYLYARADGSLYCSEWLKVGNTYYYFENVIMISDDIIEIDGQYHSFDASGKWLGEIKDKEDIPVKPDGWQKIDGQWYYYHADKPVLGRCYINGSWYAFNYDGTMIANGTDGDYYYTASGAQANYTGWQKINGQWYYFYENHTMAVSLVYIGGSYYYFERNYNDTAMAGAPAMVANTGMLLNEVLYIFNSSGSSAGPESGTGWRQGGSDWYYIVEGTPITDSFMEINGKQYGFDHNGKMVKNALFYTETAAGYGYICFDASGVAVTKTGWYQLPNGWVYVGSNGLVYDRGMYKINNQTYSFMEGYWIQ